MKEYIGYFCIRCKKEFVLLNEDVQASVSKDKYIACPYCSSKKVKKIKETDSIKECMSSRSYRRERGVMKQIR